MNKFWIILAHTYTSKLKSKSFIITTIVTALLVLALTNMQSIIDVFTKDNEAKTIAVLDETGSIYSPFEQYMTSVSDDIGLIRYAGTEKEAMADIENGEYFGLLVLTYTKEQLPSGKYMAMSIADSTIYGKLQQALQQYKLTMSTKQLGLSSEQVAQLYKPVKFETIALEENAKTEEELNQARGLVYILLFAIYFSVIMYANMIAMEVATEKSSRVMEILISSVSPVKHMFGKILGVAFLSLTQMAFLLLVGFISISNIGDLDGGVFDYLGFGNLPISTFVYAGIFFLLGYFLFATLAAFLGSLVSRIEDVQQMITPMTLLIVSAFMIAMFGLKNPEAPFITVMSFIPFFSPMIMFLRVGMLNIPMWQISVSIGLLVITITLLALFGARIYKGGVLLYGKSSSFKDIKKALQLSKVK